MLRFAGNEFPLLTWLATFAIGGVGGLAAKLVGAPLPMLIGSVIFVAVSAVARVRIAGRLPCMPMSFRPIFLPIIGLAIGGAFTPAILESAVTWWPTLVALFAYIPVVHFLGFIGYRSLGGMDPRTAYYAAVPGGLLEVIVMAEEARADVRMVTALQFMRLILTIMLVPLSFSILAGGPVGSSGGAVLAPGGDAEGIDIAILIVCGVTGYFAGKAIRLPAFIVTGPILTSGLAHLTGLTDVVPPNWMLQATQLVMGVSLGTRFAGITSRAFVAAFKHAFLNIAGTMALAVAVAFLLHGLVDQRVEAVTLALAPGGLAEMSLVAVSLEISVVYVTAHHVLRLLLSVTCARLFSHRIAPAPEEASFKP